MNISPISFGKTIKVNSSASNAEKIAYYANGCRLKGTDLNVSRQAKEIFNDAQEGEATVVGLKDSGDIYIVSGKESTKIKELQNKLFDTITSSYNNHGAGSLCCDMCNIAHQEYLEGVERIVRATRAPYSIDVQTNPDNKQITRLNIKG